MAASIRINADDAIRLAFAISARRIALTPALTEVTKASALQMQNTARSMMPSTKSWAGFAKTIRREVRQLAGGGVRATIHTTSPFGTIREFGARGYAGRPGFGTALQIHGPEWERNIIAAVDKVFADT